MSLRRLCLGPGGGLCPYRATTTGTRCRPCAAERERRRRPHWRERYGPDHESRRRELIAAEPWCHNPGCRSTDVGSPANPLTLQHLEPVVAGGRDGPASVWCKRCNSAQGARDLEDTDGRQRSPTQP